MLITAFIYGFATVWHYLVQIGHPPQFDSLSAWTSLFKHIPWDFVLLGISVFIVALAYSLPPLHLAANALGELCVSYVLTFVTPTVGLIAQQGKVDSAYMMMLIPFFVISTARMIIMNIPDREGDRLGNKITSVVLIGEDRAVQLNNLLYLATYLIIIPQLPLPFPLKVAYCLPLPFRWWQSLRVNSPEWWKNQELTDSIPFYESLYVVATVIGLILGFLWIR